MKEKKICLQKGGEDEKQGAKKLSSKIEREKVKVALKFERQDQKAIEGKNKRRSQP